MAVTDSIATATISMNGRWRHRETGARSVDAGGGAWAGSIDASLMVPPSPHPTRIAAHHGTAVDLRAIDPPGQVMGIPLCLDAFGGFPDSP